MTQHPNLEHPNMAIYDWLPAALPRTLCSTGRLDLDVTAASRDACAPLPPDIQMISILYTLALLGRHSLSSRHFFARITWHCI